MDREKLLYNGFIKGVYVNTPSEDINLLFGNDYETYHLAINYTKSRAGADDYSLTIKKVEDIDVTMKNMYLPRHFTDLQIDFSVLNQESIDYFAVEGVFAINDNEVLSYVDRCSPVLMSANFYQIEKACKLNEEDLTVYLDELRYENYERIDVLMDESLSKYEDIATAQLEQLPLAEIVNLKENNVKQNKDEVR